MSSPLPSLQVRKSLAVIEFLGWLIEKMAEVGTTSGKNFIKITSVGMGAAKSNETR